MLAGSGHIAGVVNPPRAGKYQYWINDADPAPASLDDFVAGATEHKGSWWPDWIDWLKAQAPKTVKATGARVPGEGQAKAIEDAPGRYVQDALTSAVLILPVALLALGQPFDRGGDALGARGVLLRL